MRTHVHTRTQSMLGALKFSLWVSEDRGCWRRSTTEALILFGFFIRAFLSISAPDCVRAHVPCVLAKRLAFPFIWDGSFTPRLFSSDASINDWMEFRPSGLDLNFDLNFDLEFVCSPACVFISNSSCSYINWLKTAIIWLRFESSIHFFTLMVN